MAKSSASIRRTNVENLTRGELFRELNRFGHELGWPQAAAKASAPYSTLTTWFRRRRVPNRDKSIERAREYVRKLREPEKPPPVEQLEQHEVVFWMFAAGPSVVPNWHAAKKAKLAGLVAAGSEVSRGAAYHGDLDKIRSRAESAYESNSEAASVAGDDYSRSFTMTAAGHKNLSDAFVAALARMTNFQIVDSLGGFAQIIGHRPSGTQTTERMGNFQSLWEYWRRASGSLSGLAEYFVWLITPNASRPEIYDIALWEIRR